MITKYWWEHHTFSGPEAYDFLLAILTSIVSIPLDIILSPLELIAFILYKNRRNKLYGNKKNRRK